LEVAALNPFEGIEMADGVAVQPQLPFHGRFLPDEDRGRPGLSNL
jgi:hypothetical protein